MLNYIKDFKYWKQMGSGYKKLLIIDVIRSTFLLLLGVGLYIFLNDTGLIIYLILMLKLHWSDEEERSK